MQIRIEDENKIIFLEHKKTLAGLKVSTAQNLYLNDESIKQQRTRQLQMRTGLYFSSEFVWNTALQRRKFQN